MNAHDIVKLVKRLMRQVWRDRITLQQAEAELRSQLSGDDLDWALKGYKQLRAGYGWPPRQKGTPHASQSR